MPVHVDRGESAITADDAVPTELDGDGPPSTIVPLLMTSNDPGKMRINGASASGDSPLRALSSHQQLVAVAGSGDRLAAKLFPGESIVTVHVDPLDPLPGPELAWQALDALILDGPWPGSFDVHKLPALLAGGTEIAVRIPDQPDDLLPWEPIDGGWVLRPPIAGPMGCDGTENAYAPALAWQPDLSAATRIQIVIIGVLFSVAALSCLLIGKHAVPALSAVAVVAIIAIAAWERRLPTTYEARGDMIIDGSRLQQTDRWQFITSRGSASATFTFTGEAWPVFFDTSQPREVDIVLHWKDGIGRFTFNSPPGGKLAFVSRTLLPAASTPAPSASVPDESPMTALARAFYIRNREQMTVESGPVWNANENSPIWPTVHLLPQELSTNGHE